MSTTLPFPMPLAEKYRPRAIATSSVWTNRSAFSPNLQQSVPVRVAVHRSTGTGKPRWLSRSRRRCGRKSITSRRSNATSRTSRMSFASAGTFPHRRIPSCAR